jgi:transcription factor IIIB 90 kDa subunit
MNKTAHMLIDFADALSINVYQIGATFLDLLPLVTSKDDQLPLVDPSLYISRFASRLEFGDKTQDVIRDANRIVLRFSRILD